MLRLEIKDVNAQLDLARNDLAVLLNLLDRSDLESVTFDPHHVAVRTRMIQKMAQQIADRLSSGHKAA